MTNEEKAEELYLVDYNYLGSGVISVPIKEREAFVKGAEWKEQQMIEKALSYLNNKFYFNNLFYGVVSTDFNSMEEMFEDFKKAIMEE